MDKVEKIYNLKIIKSGTKLEIYKFNNYVLREGYSKEKEPLEGQLEFNFREVPIERKKTLHPNSTSLCSILCSTLKASHTKA